MAYHGLPGQVQPEGEPLDGDEVNRVVGGTSSLSFFIFWGVHNLCHYNDHVSKFQLLHICIFHIYIYIEYLFPHLDSSLVWHPFLTNVGTF